MQKLGFSKIAIFGRPGSGKSTFATYLSRSLGVPLHHLDKHFYTGNWIERDYNEFLQIQQDIVSNESWIVDGNSTRSLEIRLSRADLVLYFNYPKMVCIFRILKRFLRPNLSFDDRAPGCLEQISWPLLKYTWNFEKRVCKILKNFKNLYPNTVFREIKCDADLKALKEELHITEPGK